MIDLEELKSRLRTGRALDINWDDEAVEAIERLQRENTILRCERERERAQREFCVKILTHIHMLLPPEDVLLPDGRRFEFKNPDIEHKILKGLAAAIRAVPDELKKSESAQPEKEW